MDDDELSEAVNAGADQAPDPLHERPLMVTFADERLTVHLHYVRQDLFDQVVKVCETTLADLSAVTGGMLPPASSAAMRELERLLDQIRDHIAQ